MPDFLHEGKETEVPETEAASASQGVKRHAFRSRRPGSGRQEKKKADDKKKKKEPSKLFTDYYGILFMFLIAAFIGAGYFVLNPLYAEFKTLNGEIESQLQTLDDERGFLDSLGRSIVAAEEIPESTLMRVDEALPRDIEIPKLLATIAMITEQNNIVLSNIQFTPAEKPKETEKKRRRTSIELVPLGINLTLQSDGYQATRKFLEDLEENVRVLDVKTITVTGNEQDGSLSYTLELTAYAIKKPTRPTSGFEDLPDEFMGEGAPMEGMMEGEEEASRVVL